MSSLLYFAFWGLAVSAPTDKLATSFSTKQWNTCTSDWFACPAAQIGKHVIEFFQYYAQDAIGFRERVGPTSLLPDKENQIVVGRYDLGYKYMMWVDSSQEPPKVINCTRGKIKVPANQTSWALDFAGGFFGGVFNGTTSCVNGTKSDCQIWNNMHTFPIYCPMEPWNKTYMGMEPEIWTLAPVDHDKLFLATFTNDIFWPEGTCLPAGHKYWHLDFSEEFSTSVDENLFKVPHDDACPLALDDDFDALLQASYVRSPSNAFGLASFPIVV